MGTIQIDGSTPKLTIGNATAEDATILFDGNAQDFYIALDDSADDLLIGLGSTVGTTPIIAIDENKLSTFSGAITVGVDDTGHDVKFFGATAGSFALWDESADALLLTDSTPIQIGDAQDLTLYHDGTNSYITNKTGALKIATETSGIALTIGHTTSETTVADNLTVTGTVTVTGGQIVFPGTQAASAGANTLDDYEEGTFTAAFATGSGTATIDSDDDTMRYTKIGREVFIGGRITVDSVSSPSGGLTITGLPFTNAALTETAERSAWSVYATGLTGSVNALQGQIAGGETRIHINEFTGTTNADIGDHMAAATTLLISGNYST